MTLLGFRAANVPEGTAAMAAYLREIGTTEYQITNMLGLPQPLIRPATGADAHMLGFRFQKNLGLFGWTQCRPRFCVMVP